MVKIINWNFMQQTSMTRETRRKRGKGEQATLARAIEVFTHFNDP